MNDLDLDLSESRLRKCRLNGKRSFLHAALDRVEAIHAALLEGLTSLVVHLPDESEGLGTDPDSVGQARYVLMDLSEKNRQFVFVNFDGETGVMTGKGAYRILKIIRQEKVSVLELGDDIYLRGSRSVASPDDLDRGTSLQSSTSEYLKPEDEELKERLAPLNDRLKRVKLEIGDASTDEIRQTLEEEREELLRRVRSESRSTRTGIGKAYQRVARALTDTRGKLATRMPRFAKHLGDWMSYDKTKNEYVYNPPASVPWEFRGFSE